MPYKSETLINDVISISRALVNELESNLKLNDKISTFKDAY